MTTALTSFLPAAAALGVVAQLAFWGVRRGWTGLIGINRLRRDLTPLHDQWVAENEIYKDLRGRIEETHHQIGVLDDRLVQIGRDISKLERTPPIFVHTLGQPGSSVRPFHGEVMFDSLAARAAGRAVSPAWHYANQLVVYASDIDSARREVERVFPEKAGYTRSLSTGTVRAAAVH
ncbi:hypothetical protein D3877_15635 [Azospirillum cavernae]|uniref:Uncharacterized protein n=1 Tax=Azospirillum cavernae TaxID=2320860 RepID=A0A418VWR0_9PROT|nr:hypothetical protein [Azospirillum cavernae]RJF81570.1 hypothetical protein D3877_15635 [Azospirillum cavernae]